MKENTKSAQRRREWEQVKDLPLKKRIAYFATYYRSHALILLAVAAILVYTAACGFTSTDVILHVSLQNIWLQKELDAETINQEFLAYAGLDPDKQEIVLDNLQTDYNTYSQRDMFGNNEAWEGDIKTIIGVTSGDMDVMLTTDTFIRQNRDKGMFADLSEILPGELLEAYQDQIYYLNSTVDDKGEFPVAIDVSQSSLMLSPDLPSYFCITSNARNQDEAVVFLQYLMER